MSFPLPATRLTVWWMRVEAPPEPVLARWKGCLDEKEQAQADRFRFVEDRTPYIAAHWLLRQALTHADRTAGAAPLIAPEAWRFVPETHGKPVVDPALSRDGLRFNLSHTKGLVACVTGMGMRVGLDVEAASRRQVGLEIAQRFFSPIETDLLRRAEPDAQISTFFRLWTLKEAFIKATGEGLYRPLDSFSFTLDPLTLSFHGQDAEAETPWEFAEMRPTDTHFLALATDQRAGQGARITFREVATTMDAAFPE